MVPIKGWQVAAHPAFVDQLRRLIGAVEHDRLKDPQGYRNRANWKLLAAIGKLAFDIIPNDPAAAAYRQGSTLGASRKHWFRAKFANGRFRLFFRFRSNPRIILYAWVNDGESLRAYGAKTDAYRVFGGMLDSGNPPDNWDALLTEATSDRAADALKESISRMEDL